MLEDVAYQSNTQAFWNSCSALCDERDYRLGGTFFDGKGQAGQRGLARLPHSPLRRRQRHQYGQEYLKR